MDVFLNAVATAVPPNDVHGAFLQIAPQFLKDPRERAVFSRMATRSGIEHRYSSLEPSAEADRHDVVGFYKTGNFPSTGARMARFKADAIVLLDKVLAELAKREGADWADGITHVVLATCTGFAAPWIDAHLVRAHGLAPTVQRLLIGFMGCNAALNAFGTAGNIVTANPEARVLVLNIELCTLHFQEGTPLATALTFMLFADGAAASIVSADPHGLQFERFASRIAPDSEEAISWHIGDSGFDMVLSGEVPRIVGDVSPAHVRALVDDPDEVALWAIHPGGRTILDAVERHCDLPPEALAVSRGVLRDFGNMSSATIPFVLNRMLEEPSQGRLGVSLGFGPGVSVEGMAFREVP
ncbi:type III polyketide synthase [Roseisalinus antarcticus]|uniref:Alpha-pyrone synthesis polyketide synthase-like Pks18 n=1 Tax=Roseisalinus antarcticus TaxID=254357 RepID=A0A1Y5TI73_9RHOB|nr:type III polyketide synthase [Roseisalinus antarcticus]SLN60939.1 Alpha-pyrone synthesis polyketide synthase-like Pks18 [Roseisalinus antarcticus]